MLSDKVENFNSPFFTFASQRVIYICNKGSNTSDTMKYLWLIPYASFHIRFGFCYSFEIIQSFNTTSRGRLICKRAELYALPVDIRHGEDVLRGSLHKFYLNFLLLQK